MIEVNFNEEVKVKLTEHGVSILKEERARLNDCIALRGGTGFGVYEPKVDEDGYTSFQIWDLMQRLGPHMGLGKLEPFEGRMIFPTAMGQDILPPTQNRNSEQFEDPA
ncbi:hypothetical protein [Paenibacillus lautus]